MIWKLHSTYKLLRHYSHKSNILRHRVSYCTDAGNSYASMPESGYLDKNDELIDSIAKATLATTSITGVPWRRRTMDSWELAFGSNAGLIPSEVAAGTLLTRASMYGSQIRWSIPP